MRKKKIKYSKEFLKALSNALKVEEDKNETESVRYVLKLIKKISLNDKVKITEKKYSTAYGKEGIVKNINFDYGLFTVEIQNLFGGAGKYKNLFYFPIEALTVI